MAKSLEGVDNFTFTCVNTAAWFVLGILIYIFMTILIPTFRNYPTEKQKYEFVCYTIGLIHGVISSVSAYYTIYYSCDGWE